MSYVEKLTKEVFALKRFNLYVQVEVAVAVALAVALSFWKVLTMPQGGSVSLDMIPLLLLAARRGTPVGLLGGLLFGLIKLLLGAYIVHPIQAILDYPLAFTVLGFAGLWVRYGTTYNDYLRNGFSLAFALMLRFVSHFISGMVFFGEYAPEGTPVWLYSLTYNATYYIPEMIVALVVVLILLARKEIAQVGQSAA